MDEVKTNDSDNARAKALDDAILEIERKFGIGSVLRLGDSCSQLNVEVVPSGSLGLDLALGVGGIPRGRITEMFGRESSGKTTLGYHVMAEAQKAGGTVLYVDVEHALDPLYVEVCGVKIEDLLISQPDRVEQALEIVETAVRSGALDVVVIDNLAAMNHHAKTGGRDDDEGSLAQLMSQSLRMLCGQIADSRSAVIFINQLNDKVDPASGIPETSPGGRALKFYATIRIELTVKDGTRITNNRTSDMVRARVVKNKVAPPFRYTEFEILPGHGIDREGEVLHLGKELGIVSQSGGHYQWGQQSLGSGWEVARKYLQEHPKAALEIEGLIRDKGLSTDLLFEHRSVEQFSQPSNPVRQSVYSLAREPDVVLPDNGDFWTWMTPLSG